METPYYVLSFLTILAIIVGPLLAVKVQRDGDREREERQRKMHVFRNIMANRATRMSPQYVEALNLIDIEFQNNRKITDKWKEMLDHLNNGPKWKDEPDKSDTRLFSAKVDSWGEKTDDHLADLLALMSEELNYRFDKVHLKKASYAPQGHLDIETDLNILRWQIIDLLDGKRPLPVAPFIPPPEAPPPQTKE